VPGGLAAANPWTRLAVLLAGPTMNLLLGVVVFSLLFSRWVCPIIRRYRSATWCRLPAALAGFKINDVIITANGVAIHDSTNCTISSMPASTSRSNLRFAAAARRSILRPRPTVNARKAWAR